MYILSIICYDFDKTVYYIIDDLVAMVTGKNVLGNHIKDYHFVLGDLYQHFTIYICNAVKRHFKTEFNVLAL